MALMQWGCRDIGNLGFTASQNERIPETPSILRESLGFFLGDWEENTS